MRFFDVEAVGFVGATTTIQYADEDDGPVTLHEVWRRPGRETLAVIERLADSAVCGFNISFDWFHLQRLYNILELLPCDRPPTVYGWLAVQRDAVFGACVKPSSALDLMLHARKGPMQGLMERDDIRVKRVPRMLAPLLADDLKRRIAFDSIYFERRQDGYQWQVEADEDAPEFPDVVLRFGAAGGLKPLARHLLGRDVQDFPIPEELLPGSPGWNPFDRAWVPFLARHVEWWATNATARKYATDDVVLTRDLWRHFGSPPPGDVDSLLACLVGSCRWRGFALDAPLLAEVRAEAAVKKQAAPRAPLEVLAGLRERVSDVEALAIEDTTKETLREIAEGADWAGTPAQEFAARVQAARSAEKEEDACAKLLHVGRFHPDFKVLGTLSGRMSGAGGLNAHGIPSEKKGSRIRQGFLMADDDLPVLDGGDFDGFEVTLAAAAYNDAQLTADLQLGKKIHALYGASMLGLDYDEVKGDPLLYGQSKVAFFATIYGAQDPKIAETFGKPVEEIAAGTRRLEERYPGVGRARLAVAERFCSMRQPGGIGSAVEWHDPAEYIESLFGFRRYFKLENTLCRALFDLGRDPPAAFQAFKRLRVSRRAGRVQTPGGAAASALYASAFAIQARNMRAAANHVIQASGAQITKALQARLWEFQPSGVHPWRLTLMQIHDEILAARLADVSLGDAVGEVVESYRGAVPLIKMEWKTGLRNWFEK